MSSSPRLTMVYDLMQHGIVTTPKMLATPLHHAIKRKTKSLRASSEPTAIIDLTQSPLSLESSPATESPHEHTYNLFVRDSNITYDIHSRQLHQNWKCTQFKKKYDLLTDMYIRSSMKSVRSLEKDKRYMSPRTTNVQNDYVPKELLKPTPTKASLPDSPFTPENQIQLRPLRGYRLQDVLHIRPITPVNYYKHSYSYTGT